MAKGYHLKAMRGMTMGDCLEARRQHEAGDSLSEIGSRIGLSVVAVKNRIRRAGGSMRDRKQAVSLRAAKGTSSRNRSSGSEHYNWHGGRLNRGGYVYLLRPGHPRAVMRGYVPEHILVVEASIGRPLEPGGVVHHVNGIRNDNRPDNLQVMTRAEHVRIHKPRSKKSA